MTKYYFSKTENTGQASAADKAIVIDGENIKFYKNGTLKTSLTVSNISMPKKSTFENLTNINNDMFSNFFNGGGETHSIDDNHAINAFAYLRANNIDNIDTTSRWPS